MEGSARIEEPYAALPLSACADVEKMFSTIAEATAAYGRGKAKCICVFKVVCSNTFDGRLRELDEDFKHSLKDLVPWLLAKEKLEVKKIYGNKVTCQQLLNNFKKYATIIREGGLPKVKSEVEALADETNRSALEKAKEFYIKGMQEKTYATLNEVKENHVKLLPQAKEQFLNSPTIDYYVSKRYLKILRKCAASGCCIGSGRIGKFWSLFGNCCR
uniref:Guanylate-binding protein n=1 Tax=Rhipicephalus zambeziensis TaxID=60191 RepID=A0A224YP66_9ACAR